MKEAENFKHMSEETKNIWLRQAWLNGREGTQTNDPSLLLIRMWSPLGSQGPWKEITIREKHSCFPQIIGEKSKDMNLEALDTSLQKGYYAIRIFSLTLNNCCAFWTWRKVGKMCMYEVPWSSNGQLRDKEFFNTDNNLVLIGPVTTSQGQKF